MPEAKFKIIRKCKVCGTEFRVKNLNSFYCSRHCSDVAYKRRKREKEREQTYKDKASAVPNVRDYISIPEAVAMFAVGRTTLYKLIRDGTIPVINLGSRLMRIDRKFMEQRYQSREVGLIINEQPLVKTYRLEKEDCYSIGEVTEKFGVSPTTVYTEIRKNSIPTRQIGKYVYVPKVEIDNLFK